MGKYINIVKMFLFSCKIIVITKQQYQLVTFCLNFLSSVVVWWYFIMLQ